MACERNIPASMDPLVVAEIDVRLDTIVRENSVRILFAVESGSRAWGFPSPDSDYDCRFVYVRGHDDYLSLFPKRDVIETAVTPVFDVNGWDVAKALKLMLSGNAVIIEWLTSPIVYRADTQSRADILALAGQIADRNRIAKHYMHLAKQIAAKYLDDPNEVALKKIFYALRPVVALRWLSRHPDARIAPMNFQQLCAGAGLSSEVESLISKLLVEKAASREMGRGPLPGVLAEFIGAELKSAAASFPLDEPPTMQDRELADWYFRKLVAQG